MKPRVLYIEDNEQNFYLVHYILSARGFEVRRARDGREGLQATAEGPFDLILLDIQLPVLDGYAVARALREKEDLRSIPIVALTSYAMPGDREKALESGCTGYLEKPIDPATFAQSIEGYVRKAPEVIDP